MAQHIVFFRIHPSNSGGFRMEEEEKEEKEEGEEREEEKDEEERAVQKMSF